MSVRVLLRLMPGMGLLAVVLACSMVSASGSQSTSAPRNVPTIAQNGISIFASPIRMVIPDELGAGATAETIDVVTDQTGAPWDVAPAHLQLTLQGYSVQNTFHVPQFFVYPAQEYAAANQRAAGSIQRLQAILESPNSQFANDMLPYVPFFNAGQVFAAQEKVMHFNNGSGLRVITQYGQDVSPISNSGLLYHFEGLTTDGKYYLVAILPTNLPFLPADNNPASSVSSGGVPFPPNDASGSSFDNYYKQVGELIDGASEAQFNPPLKLLDALIQSISAQ